ncbi:hypothetical protein ABDK09_13145 [Vibrio sp. CDRSL-10 TSBA]
MKESKRCKKPRLPESKGCRKPRLTENKGLQKTKADREETLTAMLTDSCGETSYIRSWNRYGITYAAALGKAESLPDSEAIPQAGLAGIGYLTDDIS